MAYNVAILDDEELMREGLMLKFPFHERGFEVIFSGEDGHELLKKIEQKEWQIDLILVDIMMPKLNGLEFIHQLRSATPEEIEIVIISGHDNFEFAQKAIRLGVCDYLLKPLDPTELEHVMQKVIASLENKALKNKYRLQDEITNWLLSYPQWIDLCQEAAAYLTDLMQTNRDVYVTLFGNRQTSSPVYQQVRRILTAEQDFDISHQGALHLFLHFDHRPDFVEKLFRQFDFPTITVLQLTNLRDYRELPQGVSFAVHVLFRKLTLGKRGFLKIKWEKGMESRTIKIDEAHLILWQQFEKNRQQKNVHELKNFLEQDLPQHIKENVMLQISREYMQSDISPDWMQQYDEPAEFMNECLYLIQKSSDSIRPTRGKEIVQCVLRDLETEYFLNFTIKDYADRYHIHPNHLVRLFKQEVQSTFYQTVTQIRMEKAKYDLQHSSKKISQIAADVGFDDPRYFTQVFRKMNQLTPVEYRNIFQNS